MSDVTHVVVQFPLTDAQIEAFVMGSECGNTPDETVRAVGTSVPDTGLEVAAHERMTLHYGWQSCVDDVEFYRSQGQQIRQLVCKNDADALVATRDAEIAELRARLETVERETREACAKACDGQRLIEISMPADWHNDACKMCAVAIRSAGEKG